MRFGALKWGIVEHFSKKWIPVFRKKMRQNKKREWLIALTKIKTALFCLLLAGCVSTPPSSRQWQATQAALPVMEQIAINAGQCWFKSGAEEFKPYRLAPELKSFSDRPRILLVPYATPTARPLLVVEASGNPATVSAYGPLMEKPIAKRIAQDLTAWLKGSATCH